MALTPYDTGARAEPKLWITSTVASDHDRTSNIDPDKFGKVDFEDDSSQHIVTLWIEKRDGEHVLVVDGGVLPVIFTEIEE